MGSIFNHFFNKDRNERIPGEIIYTNKQPENDPIIKFKANIYGRVQGVGFRYTTVHLAKKINVNGIVRNENDGSVYVEATGEKDKINLFIEELAKGPSPSADVDKIEISYDSSIQDYRGFGERHWKMNLIDVLFKLSEFFRMEWKMWILVE